MERAPTPRTALIALTLLAPVPTLGVLAAMVAFPGPLGQGLFAAAKLWLLALPLLWHLLVEGGRPGWSPLVRGGLGLGLAVGLASAAAIAGAAWLLGDRIDPGRLAAEASEMGLAHPGRYVLAAAYWIFVNSVVEEYVYRWFVFRQCRALLARWPAIVAANLVFTAHHVLAVGLYLEPSLAALASLGVFLGGCSWSWLYDRTGSVWPGWLAHALADVAVFAVGWRLLFGA